MTDNSRYNQSKGDDEKEESEISKEVYQRLFKSIDEGFCIVKLLFDNSEQAIDYRFLKVNTAFKKHTGLKNVEGKKISELVPGYDKYWFTVFGKVALEGESVRFEHADEALNRYFDVYAFPLRDSDHRQVAILLNDITKRQDTEKQLKQMNKTLEERVDERTAELQSYQKQLRSLASELSKAEEQERQRLATELHNNLGQMLAVAKMKLNDLEGAEFPENMSNIVMDLSAVIDDALSYTRELMTELKPPPVLDKEGIREILNWVVKEIEKYDLKVTIEDDERPKPLTEEVQTALYQCVRELLTNAVKYAGVNEVRLQLLRDEDNVRITVEDEGKGFKIKENEPITTEDGGVGLFNIRERMDWIGGGFEITSEPGEGTKATLFAPVKNKVQPDLFANSSEMEDMLMKKKNRQTELWSKLEIIIADDHKMVRNGFRQMIDKQDDMIVTGETSDGESVVQLAREVVPDVILMDVNMPKMDGIEASKIISSELPEICIIGLSLHDSDEVVQNMMDAGASAYLSKDQAFEVLCETIRKEAKQIKKSE